MVKQFPYLDIQLDKVFMVKDTFFISPIFIATFVVVGLYFLCLYALVLDKEDKKKFYFVTDLFKLINIYKRTKKIKYLILFFISILMLFLFFFVFLIENH